MNHRLGADRQQRIRVVLEIGKQVVETAGVSRRHRREGERHAGTALGYAFRGCPDVRNGNARPMRNPRHMPLLSQRDS